MKKSVIAIFIIAFLWTLMFLTTPSLLHSTQVGLEFRGGYEVLYAINSLEPGIPLEKSILLKTATILKNRAVSLGVAEPDIAVEGNNLIRVKLAGISGNGQAQAILNQSELLPVKLTEKYSQTVAGILGEADFRATLMAVLLVVYGTFLFIGIVYQGPGYVAVLALTTYLWLLLVVFNLLHITLSLETAVAFVLGVGIASNANILSFERIKEELSSGKAKLLALREGDHQAFRAILDSNAMILIGALVLFSVGIAPIRGFALTTVISILISFVSNVFLARLLLNLLVQGNIIKSPLFLGLEQGTVTHFRGGVHVIRHRIWFFTASALFALFGAFTLLTTPLNLDVDFKSGTALDVSLNQPITQIKATALIEEAGFKPATVVIGGDQKNQIFAQFDNALNPVQVAQIVDSFKKNYGSSVASQENTTDPFSARELIFKAVYAIAFSILGIFGYVTWRFGWQYGVAATVGILNSAFFVVSMFAIFHYEIDVTFIAAILTIIGFSAQNTIVVFDRIRENMQLVNPTCVADLTALVNQSIWQTLKRSIYSILTVVTGALSLFYFGAEALNPFSLAILLGLACGAYSSIFIAVPLWFLLRQKSLPTLNSGSFIRVDLSKSV